MLLGLGAAIAANLGGAAALAGPAQRPVVVVAEPEPAATRHVSYADLDLATRDGERKLIRRLRVAVNNVCAEEVGPAAIFYVEMSCRKLTWHDTKPQLESAVRHGRQMAGHGNSSIAAAVIVVRPAK
jgi:UrcA family protein